MRFYKKWNDSMIINHILARHGKKPLNSHYYSTRFPNVFAAAERVFGSWGNAIEASGLDYSKIKKYQTWSRARVLRKIKKQHKDGKPITSKYVQEHNRPLYMAAVRRFKGWKKALKAAGFNDYERIRLRRKLSKAEIKRQIQELHQQKVDLSYTNMRKNHQYLLAAGAKKLGNGSWAKARKKCGIKINYRVPKYKRAA